MSRFFLHWLTLGLALAATAWLLPGVVVYGWFPLLIGSLVLGLVNAIVRPLLALISLPLTVLTLGLFYLVVNGVSFGLAAWLVPGFVVATWWDAVLGALICSVLSAVFAWFTGDGRRPQRRRRDRDD